MEISEFAAQWGRENLNIPIYMGSLRDAGFADEEFDVVVLWDVLEHLTEPLAELREINRILKKGGYLFVSVPDIGSLWSKVMGKRWFGYAKIREHVYFYNRRSLARVMQRAGLEVRSAQSSPFLVNLDFLVSKLSQYNNFFASALAKSLGRLHLRNKKISLRYVDLMVVAQKDR